MKKPADRKQYNFRLGAEDAYLRAELQSDAKKPNGYIAKMLLLGMLAEKSGFSVAGDSVSPRLAWPTALSNAIGPHAVANTPAPASVLMPPVYAPAPAPQPQIRTETRSQPAPAPIVDETNDASSNLDNPEVAAIFDTVLIGLPG